jgi:hypothetical protein
MAFFQNNQSLLSWVNQQPLSQNVSCLGDGHDGVGNIVEQIGTKHQRREILDWYHLMENLHKVGGSNQRLRQQETSRIIFVSICGAVCHGTSFASSFRTDLESLIINFTKSLAFALVQVQ